MLSSYKTRNGGFTLIEALVALLVLSIGLLGVAAMQLEALKSAHAAYQRSIASLAAQDAQERLWAQLNVGDGLCPDWGLANALGEPDWNEKFVNQEYRPWDYYLPGHASSSSVEPGSECVFTISIKWSEGRFSDEGNPDFNYTVRLPGE